MRKQLNFFNTGKRAVDVHAPFTFEEFKATLLKYKPTDLYNIQWSREKPLYILTEIDEEGVTYYAAAWADQTPVKKSFSDFYAGLNMDGIGNLKIKVDIPFTWEDMKSFVNGLSEEDLQQPVRAWGEEIAFDVTEIQVMEEDWINPSGDGCEPVSVYEGEPDFDLEMEEVVLQKGDIRLWIEK